MTKQDFLEELKQALAGEVPANVMMDSYSYYANYIDDEIRNGKSEEEVFEELGKPSLIARSIIAAQTGERTVDYEYTEDGRTKTVKNRDNRSSGKRNTDNEANKRQSANKNERKSDNKQMAFEFSGILARVAFILFMLLLVVVFYFIVKVGFWVLVTFGIPILIVLGIIYLIMYFAR